MRTVATALLLVTVTMVASRATPRQDTAPAPRRPRIIAVLSNLLTHSPLVTCSASRHRTSGAPTRLRIATWNIKAAQEAPVDALAAELRAMDADVIALQEVDVRTRRGGFVDEPGDLARALGFHYAFAASIEWDEGHYGLAVLSRWPLVAVTRHRLESSPEAEPRIVLDVTVCADGRPLHVLDHHADRRTASRALGFADVRRILEGDIGRGVLVMGDLNEYPDAPGVRSLIEMGLVDLSASGLENTLATGRVDYLLADAPLARLASAARVWTTDKSDHHAMLADLSW